MHSGHCSARACACDCRAAPAAARHHANGTVARAPDAPAAADGDDSDARPAASCVLGELAPWAVEHIATIQTVARLSPDMSEGGSRGRGSRGRGRRGKRRGARGRDNAPVAVQASPTGGRWWESVADEDPISLEPIADLNYPPFSLTNDADSQATTHFDGRVLAQYLVSTGTFEHPITRRELTHEECLSLDAYLALHKLGTGRVAEAHSRKDEYKPDAEGNRGALGLQVEASTLLEALFENSNRYGLRRQQQQQQGRGRGRGSSSRAHGRGAMGGARAGDLELQAAIRASLELAQREKRKQEQRRRESASGHGRTAVPPAHQLPREKDHHQNDEPNFWAQTNEDDEKEDLSKTVDEIRQRNSQMVSAMDRSVGGDTKKLSEMKRLSQQLRKRQVSTDDFVQKLTTLAGGADAVDSFWSDLLLLLQVGDDTGAMAAVANELRMSRSKQLRQVALTQASRRHFHRPAVAQSDHGDQALVHGGGVTGSLRVGAEEDDFKATAGADEQPGMSDADAFPTLGVEDAGEAAATASAISHDGSTTDINGRGGSLTWTGKVRGFQGLSVTADSGGSDSRHNPDEMFPTLGTCRNLHYVRTHVT